MYEDAVAIAKKVDDSAARTLLRRAPISRQMRAKIAASIGVELPREEGDGVVRAKTKDEVIGELKQCKTELDKLDKAQKESLGFLSELEAWGAKEAPAQSQCALCHRPVFGIPGHRFPCGHVLHDACLVRRAELLLSGPELTELRALLGKKKLDKYEIERREALLASDCPMCGEIAVPTVHHPLDLDQSNEWSLEREDLQRMGGLGPSRRGLLRHSTSPSAFQRPI
jgi:hypothetical protein